MAVKNCPFCGGPPTVAPQDPEDKDTDYAVICRDCKTSTRLFLDGEDAVTFWNKRTPIDNR